MNKEEYLKSANDMIYLIRCIVNDKKPSSDKVENINLENLYTVSSQHMLTSITAMALESAGIEDNSFTQAKGKAFRKIAVLDIERALLFQYLDSKGIWYMPLKGIVMKDYYPEYGMRQMSDNDILFDPKYRPAVKEYFESCGYETDEYGEGNHDVYFKAPVSNFEMHVGLFHQKHAKRFPTIYNYYQDVKDRLIKSESGSEYHFGREDFYLFMTAHEYKHYYGGGTGLRSVLDTYMFMKKFGDTLDMKYIEGELEKLGIAEFEHESRKLAMNLFGRAAPTGKNGRAANSLNEEERSMFEYIVFSGTYGNKENAVVNKINREGGKLKYVWGRIFPPLEKLKSDYPVFFKYKILIVFLPFYRFIKILTVSKKRVKRELKALSKH